MANLTQTFGLSPVSYLHGNEWTGQFRLYYIAQNDANAYAIGDPVATSSGVASAGGISAVTLATAGASNAIRGVIVTAGSAAGAMPANVAGTGFYDPNNLGSIIIPASKTQPYFVGVMDDPDIIYECIDITGQYTAADIGKNCNLKSGINNGYVSGWSMDTTAVSSTSNTRQLKILGLSQRKNNTFGAYAAFLVCVNQHELNFPSSGV